ncbi:hypothetical protein THAOC_13518, partial [Thalassiosira oceanica]
MPFGQIYLSSQHPKWAGEYIDYGRLKKLIKPLLKAAYPEYYQRRLSVDDSSEDTTTRPLIAQQKIAEMEDFRSNILTRVGCKLLLLLEFVELNIQAIDNIVKKHDK